MLNFGTVYLGVCRPGTLSTLIPSTLDAAHVWFNLTGSQSTWVFAFLILSTRKSVHMTNFKLRIVSTASSVQSGLCSLLVLSTRESVHLGVCLLGICPLGSLATYYSAHIALYQLSVRSIVASADDQSCLLGSQSNRVSVYLQCIYF